MIAFLADRADGVTHLSVMAADGTDMWQLASIPDVTGFSWSPDGQMILFASAEPVNEHYYRTYLVSATNPQPFVLCELDAPVWSLNWSPADDEIFTIVALERIPIRFVYILDLEGNARPLPLSGSPSSAAWDPTGQRIAYDNVIYTPDFGQGEINVINADGTEEHAVTEIGKIARRPQWSPNGDKIAYESHLSGEATAIVVIDLNSNDIVQISPAGVASLVPAWSPDGKFIAFLTETDQVEVRGYSLSVFSMETHRISTVVDEFVSKYSIAWKP